MWSQPARVARRLARWPVVLAILVTGLAVIGWGRTGRAALTVAGGTAEATWPALRLLWPGLVVLAVAGLLSRSGRALLGRARIDIRFSWLVSGLALAVVGLVVLSLLVFPGYLVQRSLDATGTPTLGPAERLKAENDARTTLLQGVAGLVLVVGAGATWRQLQINREGQITERFNKAIDHLGEPGNDKLDVRLGGIYALERIANNSKDDRATIAEILTAYVRGHAAWTPPAEDTIPPDAAIVVLAELRVRAPDIQAAMTVLGRRALPPGKPQPLSLAGIDLRNGDLRRANLAWAILDGAHLEGANLQLAHLEGASLIGAHLEAANLQLTHLEGANLQLAHLEGANLNGVDLSKAILHSARLKRVSLDGAQLKEAGLVAADLEGASLHGVDLEGAILEGANLKEAILFGAHLEGAFLDRAHLEGASLNGADLSKAILNRAHLEGARLDGAHLEGASLDGAHLERASATSSTSWPNGFNWKDARVQMEE